MNEQYKRAAAKLLSLLAWGGLVFFAVGALVGLKHLPDAINRASDIYLCVEAVKLDLHPAVCDDLLTAPAKFEDA